MDIICISTGNNHNNPIKEKNLLSSKETNQDDIDKRLESDSNIKNKDFENVLRKSSDFYLLPKILHQNTTIDIKNNLKENSLFLKKRKNLLINKTMNLNNNSNLLFTKNDSINETETYDETLFKSSKKEEGKNKKNFNYVDESYFYKFKPSSRKSMILTNFNNTKKKNMNLTKHDNESISVTQKNFDFKSLIDNEKFEEEKRLTKFFNKLNLSSINNNLPSMLNFNKTNNNLCLTNGNSNQNNLNNELHKNLNTEGKNNNIYYNYNNNLQNTTIKGYGGNSVILTRNNKSLSIASGNNFTSYVPKNDFDSIGPRMRKSSEIVLNSLDTIKNRNKLKIINKKLKIKKEVPIQSYMITSVKPISIYDFTNKLKNQIVINKEIEIQKNKNFKNNPNTYLEDEENSLNNENEDEYENEREKILSDKNRSDSYKNLKYDLNKENNEDNFKNLNSNKNNKITTILDHLKIKNTKSTNLIAESTENNCFNISMFNNNTNNINQELANISGNKDLSEFEDSSYINQSKINIEKKFENEDMLFFNKTNEGNFAKKKELDYFLDKDEKGNTIQTESQLQNNKNLSYKKSLEKPNFKPFFDKQAYAKDIEEEDDSKSHIGTIGSLEEDKIHNLDNSGILQTKEHESLYVKAQRKLNKNLPSNDNTINLTIKSSFIKSPNILAKESKFSTMPIIQLNPIIPLKLNENEKNNNLSSLSNGKNLNSENSITKNIYDANILKTIESGFINGDIVKNMRRISINAIDINNKINNNSKNDLEINNIKDHDFEVYEVQPNVKTTNEINKIKNQLIKIRKSKFDYKNDFLNDIHKNLQKKACEINEDYENCKDILLQYRQEKILEKKEYKIFTKLHIKNRNPIFQINNMITFPEMINDPVLLADIYNINMYKMENKMEIKKFQ